MQPKRPRFNPLILALALAAVLMIWSVLGTSDSSTSGSTMSYSTVVHYFEHNQVTKFTLDRNTSVITLTLKEGDLDLPQAAAASTADSTGGLLSGMLSSSSADSTAAEKNSDGTVTVRYKLPYAYVFIENVQSYIDSYDAANPTAPMEYDYTSLKETIPWMEIIFYLGMLGCTGFLLFSMMRGGVGGGGGIMNVGKAKVKDEHENKKTATFADVAGEDEEKEELLCVAPGITGLWQATERNGATFESGLRQKIELHYVRNRCFGMDWKCFTGTFGAMFGKRRTGR